MTVPPEFPGADEVRLSGRNQRDLTDLGRSLKFSNPHELLAHWTLFVRRLVRDEERFEIAAVLSYLLREIFGLYRAQLHASAARLEEARAEPRLDEAAVLRAERAYAEQVDYQQKVAAVLPQLRQLLHEAAQEVVDEA